MNVGRPSNQANYLGHDGRWRSGIYFPPMNFGETVTVCSRATPQICSRATPQDQLDDVRAQDQEGAIEEDHRGRELTKLNLL